MNKNILWLVLLSFAFKIYGQQNDTKRDNTWLLGYGGEGPTKDTFFSNMSIDFSKKPIEAQKIATDMYMRDDVAMISDSSGKLLFYTNGIYVADKTHQPMKNGGGLNPGKLANTHQKYGYICNQGSLVLPKPGTSNLFYLLHSSLILDPDDPINDYKGEYLYYTLIDISLNNGKGEVIEKNKILLDKFVDTGKITACQHSNGKDWWILMADFDNRIINKFLLNKNGIEKKAKQDFVEGGKKGGLGQAVFSPDGTKYARINLYSIFQLEISIFDFDRCSGKLSNPQYIEIKNDTSYSCGMAIAPNSKYLYAMSGSKIYQFDLTANDVFSTLDTVAVHDGVTFESFSTRFYLAQLAPDNKIYITIPSTSKFYHVIENPDKKGKACNVKQRGFELPFYNYTTMPNFPYFRLGAAATQCITSDEEITGEINIKIYPNPATDYIYLDYDKEKIQHSQLIISDIQGKTILQKTLNDDKIDVHDFPKGIYFLQILKENKVVFREKVVILE